MDNEPSSRWGDAAVLLAIPFEFLGAICGGALVGYLGDRALGTAPWLLIVGSLLGTSGGFVRMLQIARHYERKRKSG